MELASHTPITQGQLGPYFIRRSMDMAQMFLQRLSRLLVVCWMESHSVSLAQASESCRRTSQMLNTDSTPALCCSMSRCRSCNDRRGRGAVSWRREGWHPRTPPSSPGDTVLRAFLPGTLQCRLRHLCATPVLQHLTGGLAEGSRGVKVLK